MTGSAALPPGNGSHRRVRAPFSRCPLREPDHVQNGRATATAGLDRSVRADDRYRDPADRSVIASRGDHDRGRVAARSRARAMSGRKTGASRESHPRRGPRSGCGPTPEVPAGRRDPAAKFRAVRRHRVRPDRGVRPVRHRRPMAVHRDGLTAVRRDGLPAFCGPPRETFGLRAGRDPLRDRDRAMSRFRRRRGVVVPANCGAGRSFEPDPATC